MLFLFVVLVLVPLSAFVAEESKEAARNTEHKCKPAFVVVVCCCLLVVVCCCVLVVVVVCCCCLLLFVVAVFCCCFCFWF